MHAVHGEWRSGRHLIAAEGGADRRSAKNAAAPINQSREAHHSPRGAMSRTAWSDYYSG
jgi:hypothetical protein